jgi:uncharacterized membrane protein YccC
MGSMVARQLEELEEIARQLEELEEIARQLEELEEIARQLEELEEMRAAFDARRTSGLAAIVRGEGTWVYANLQAFVHHEPVDPGFSNRDVARWLRFAQQLGTGFGRKVLHQGVEQLLQGD